MKWKELSFNKILLKPVFAFIESAKPTGQKSLFIFTKYEHNSVIMDFTVLIFLIENFVYKYC